MDEIIYWHELKKPVLVGTVSVEVSEVLSRLLKRRGIAHNVLNARQHQREAEIIAEAGQPGAVTIATNMAGRGTDIKLGEGVVTQDKESYRDLSPSISEQTPYGIPLDGLHVIGSERHESRRIDRQLRGRAGRQGDPEHRALPQLGRRSDAALRLRQNGAHDGKTGPAAGRCHPPSLDDQSGGKGAETCGRTQLRDPQNLIKYDEVMNQQREVIYSYRRSVLKGYSLKTR